MRFLAFRRLSGAVLVVLLLTGCGHQPLYRKDADGGVSASLAQVSIEEQKTRAGQLVRNELISSFRTGGSEARYVLRLTVTEKVQDVSSLAFQKVDRHRYRLNVAYQLFEAGSGNELTRGNSFSNVSYDTVEEPVADLQAAESARDRATRELSQDIKLRLAAFLATRAG